MSYSLQGRLSLGLVISLVLLFVVQWAVVSYAVKTVSENYVASRLSHDADALLGAVSFDKEGKLVLNQARIDGIYHQPFSGHYFQIFYQQQLSRSRSLWDQVLKLPEPLGKSMYIGGPEHQALLANKFEFKKNDQQLIIVVAEDLTALYHDIGEFRLQYALVSFAVLMLVMFVQAWVVQRSLRPLDGVIDEVKQLERGDATKLSENVPDEVRHLVVEFNRLLDLMQQRLSRSRSALGNLAHALKTPLTVLTRLRDNEEVTGEAEALLGQQTDKIRQLLDYQLKRARLAGSSAPGWQFNVYEELSPLVKTLQRMYADKQISIDLDVPEAKIYSGDREDLLELFGNLLDNACKWAEHKVHLTVIDCAGLCFCVEDDGPGCSANVRQELTTRGRRVDESTLGHGLGLAIVKDIVDQYSGEMSFDQSETLGGFKVSVNLPDRSSD